MTILGHLAGEPPEPMTKEQFEAARKRIRDSWNGSVTFTKRDAERLIARIARLKRRLQRVEHAIEPLVEDLRREE
jgi:polyhydroxyalkanoate synthesis regulator phasin